VEAHPRGRLITLEGPEGAGKTVLGQRLATALVAAGHSVVLTREPGGTRLGERLRSLLLEHGG
jgi:dTMP kinase